MKNIVENCMGASETTCKSSCPMNTDVKTYVRLIGEGKGKEAIRTIRETLFLPGTLGRICAHPCEQNCRRAEEGSSIAIATLKRYAADNFDNEEDWDLSVKNKNGKKVAIVGAGPAGAQGAIDLIKEGYTVTIFDKASELGGMMRIRIPEYKLPRAVIDREYSLLEKLGVNIQLSVEIGKDILFEELEKEYDAILIATGEEAERRLRFDELTLQLVDNEKVYVAGNCANARIVVEAMSEGRRAAKSIDRYLTGKSLKEGRFLEAEGVYQTKLYLLTEFLPEGGNSSEKNKRIVPKIVNGENFGFTAEEARKEANRCLKCECKLCMKECSMLNDYTDCPKNLFAEYLEKGYKNMNPKIAYSCNMCNQCTLKCPKNLDLKTNFSNFRSEYIRDNGGKSPMKGHKAIEAHQYLGYSKLFNTTNSAPNGKKTKYIFFPGCSLPSYDSVAIGSIMDHLQNRLNGEVGSILKCCGKPTKSLEQDELFSERFYSVQLELDKVGAETVIVACQSCYEIFGAYAKQNVVSLWELLPEIGLPESQVGIGKGADIKFNIHDSCPTRNQTKIHDGIRWTMKKLGYEVEELKNSREKTRCCGFGGMVVPAVPEVAKKVMNRRASETTTGHMVTYCAACRESMENEGADAVHIVDLIFGDKYEKLKAKKRNMGPLKQWLTRYKSKIELNKRRRVR